MAIKLIGCGNISIHHIHPLLSSAFYLLRSYAFLQLKENFKGNWEDNNPIFLVLIMFLGESVVGLFDLIERNRNQKKLISKQRKLTMESYVNLKMRKIQNNRNNRNHTLAIFLMIFSLAAIEFICFYGLQHASMAFEGGSDLQTEIRTFKLLSDSFFCYLVLKYRVHCHHFLSIFMLILGITLVTIQDIITMKYHWFLVFIFFGHSFLISIRDIWEKWIIQNKFVSAVTILFFRGIYGSVISFILGLIFLALPQWSIFKSFEQIFTSNGWAIFWFIVYFICCIFYNFFYSMTKQYFNPSHTAVSDSFSTVMWIIILEILPSTTETSRNWAFLTIGYLLVVFGCLLYNDIIILYFCGLEDNTKYEVTQRSINEMISIENAHLDNNEEDNEIYSNNIDNRCQL